MIYAILSGNVVVNTAEATREFAEDQGWVLFEQNVNSLPILNITGSLSKQSRSNVVLGLNTNFTSELSLSNVLVVNDQVYFIENIISDTQLFLNSTDEIEFTNNVAYTYNEKLFQPKIGWHYNNGIFTAPPRNLNEEWMGIRMKRDQLLLNSDVKVLPDIWNSMTQELQQAWSIYRQSLRDIPETYSDPEDVVWPIAPA